MDNVSWSKPELENIIFSFLLPSQSVKHFKHQRRVNLFIHAHITEFVYIYIYISQRLLVQKPGVLCLLHGLVQATESSIIFSNLNFYLQDASESLHSHLCY
jgi:hypothetical protein